ncbi:MAG: RNA-protein complex protein Nop10 [Thaumarchaeota archaeon]|nr:RNA-protein complex protein Nop10 [Nitrososphaerota archaeon]
MKGLLLKCPNCHTYTMKGTCPKCGTATVVAHPAKYSPDDKYARYRNPLAYQTETETDKITE